MADEILESRPEPSTNKKRVSFLLRFRTNYFDYEDYTADTKNFSSGLLNSATYVSDMLKRNGYDTVVEQVLDANKIDEHVHRFKPDVVVIEAYWAPPEKLAELQKLHPTVHFMVRNHSDLPFAALEGVILEWSLAYSKLGIRVASNSRQTTNDMRQSGVKSVYLPNYFRQTPSIRKIVPLVGPLEVGCFGAIRPLKNQLVQAVAAIRLTKYLGRKLRFHMNTTRIEMKGAPILKNLRALFSAMPGAELVEHPWMPYPEFKKLMRKMDITFQVSYSETFNITGADSINAGIPLVASDRLPWLIPSAIADPNDSKDIKNKAVYALNHPFQNVQENAAQLQTFSEEAEKRWRRHLRILRQEPDVSEVQSADPRFPIASGPTEVTPTQRLTAEELAVKEIVTEINL